MEPKPYRCFAQDWAVHRREAQAAMKKVDLMSTTIAEMSGHTKNLTQLHQLDTLKVISGTLERLEETLVSAATGRKQIPLVSHILMMVVLGAALLVVLMEKTTKTIKIGTSGIEIGESSIGVGSDGGGAK